MTELQTASHKAFDSAAGPDYIRYQMLKDFPEIASSLIFVCSMGSMSVGKLVYSARRSDHVSPLLRDLHWLRILQRIEFSLAVLV